MNYGNEKQREYFNNPALQAGQAIGVNAPRNPEVPEQIAELSKSASLLEAVIGDLAAKLIPVCRIEPETCAAGGVGRGTSTQVGGELAGISSRIEASASALNQLTRRIEL